MQVIWPFIYGNSKSKGFITFIYLDENMEKKWDILKLLVTRESRPFYL